MSENLFNHKEIEGNGDIVEMKLWAVPVSSSAPEGISYRFVVIRGGKRLLGYDNENHGTGLSNHHKHIRDRMIPYQFVDKWKLFEDFGEDLEKVKRGVIK